MLYQMRTSYLFCLLLCFGLLNFYGVAFAQVYKSYDADGNVIYSDKPNVSSKEVEISEPNVSESFKAAPSDPAPPAPESKPAPAPETPEDPESSPVAEEDHPDTNNDGRISRREIDDYRDRQRKKRRAEKKANGEGGEEDWY